MPSKTVVDKQKSATALISIGRASAISLAKAFAARYAAKLPPGLTEEKFVEALTFLINAPCNELDDFSTKMSNADENYNLEIADDDEPRRLRDAAFQFLYTTLVEARETLHGVFGQDSLKDLGFSRTTPQDPAQLCRFAKEIVGAIKQRQKDNTLPVARRKLVFDFDTLISELEEGAEKLSGHLNKVALEQRELQIALAQKNTTIDDYDALFGDTASLFVALFRFTGQDELAGKVRPSERSPGQLETPPAEDNTNPTQPTQED